MRKVLLVVTALIFPGVCLGQYDGAITIGPSLDTSQSIINDVLVQEAGKRAALASDEVMTSPHTTGAPTSVRLNYNVSRQSALVAQRVYVERLEKRNTGAARALEQQLRMHNFGQVYSGIVAPFGLRRGDIGDAMTAYTLLGWMIATG